MRFWVCERWNSTPSQKCQCYTRKSHNEGEAFLGENPFSWFISIYFQQILVHQAETVAVSMTPIHSEPPETRVVGDQPSTAFWHSRTLAASKKRGRHRNPLRMRPGTAKSQDESAKLLHAAAFFQSSCAANLLGSSPWSWLWFRTRVESRHFWGARPWGQAVLSNMW